ncbi:MAG: SpoVG family protein [Candidatus Omnitrophica bacterium]|nr:SpoVG family protein [Candidatus Omnitrophota bacterium]
MDKALKFCVKRIYKLDGDGNTKAFVDLSIDESLLIKGLRIVEGKKGLFVSMPREQGKDNQWYDTIRPLNKEIKQEISTIVLSAYEKEVKI